VKDSDELVAALAPREVSVESLFTALLQGSLGRTKGLQ